MEGKKQIQSALLLGLEAEAYLNDLKKNDCDMKLNEFIYGEIRLWEQKKKRSFI